MNHEAVPEEAAEPTAALPSPTEEPAAFETSAAFARRHDLDALRAWAMLLGIVLHGLLSFEAIWFVRDRYTAEWAGWLNAAIHGFRMPLFFLLSGFFTAMLWRKRGLGSLLWHRTRRILFPFLLGLVTVVPVTIGVGVWGDSQTKQADVRAAENEERGNEKEPGPNAAVSLHAAIEAGDAAAVRRHIEDGADIEAFGGELQSTPLNLAAIRDRPEAARLLLDAGADPNALGKDGGTALLTAAFLGRGEIAEMLLAAGANPNLKKPDGSTPATAALAGYDLTKAIADMIGAEVEPDELAEGRKRFFAALAKVDQSQFPAQIDTPEQAAAKKRKADIGALLDAPILVHLWFLWFLVILVAAFVPYAAALRWSGATLSSRPARWLTLGWGRFLWLLPLTYWGYAAMTQQADFGPDTFADLTPPLPILAFYGLFFFYGAMWFDAARAEPAEPDTLATLRREDERPSPRRDIGNGWPLMLAAAAITLLAGYDLFRGDTLTGWGLDPSLVRPLMLLTQTLYVWLMTFGLIGLFRRAFPAESKTARYISDSSYFLYLAHLPVVIAAQVWMMPLTIWPSLKAAIIIGGTSLLLLGCYAAFVRHTPIGWLLNGRRRKTA